MVSFLYQIITAFLGAGLILHQTCHCSKIDTLREKLLKEFATSPRKYHPFDKGRVANVSDPWHVERYLKFARGDMSRAYELAVNALEWKQSYGIHNITSADFPCEFLYSGLLQMTSDREGSHLAVGYIETFRRYPDVREHLIKYITWVIELVDREAGPKGFAGFVSLENAGLEHVDPPLMRYLFPVPYRYPSSAKYMVVHEPGIILGPVVKMIVSWMPQEIQHLVKITSGPQAYKYVKKNNLPKCAGGRRAHTGPIAIIPDPDSCTQNIWDIARRLGWAKDNVQFYLSIVSPYVKAHKLLNANKRDNQ